MSKEIETNENDIAIRTHEDVVIMYSPNTEHFYAQVGPRKQLNARWENSVKSDISKYLKQKARAKRRGTKPVVDTLILVYSNGTMEWAKFMGVRMKPETGFQFEVGGEKKLVRASHRTHGVRTKVYVFPKERAEEARKLADALGDAHKLRAQARGIERLALDDHKPSLAEIPGYISDHNDIDDIERMEASFKSDLEITEKPKVGRR